MRCRGSDQGRYGEGEREEREETTNKPAENNWEGRPTMTIRRKKEGRLGG